MHSDRSLRFSRAQATMSPEVWKVTVRGYSGVRCGDISFAVIEGEDMTDPVTSEIERIEARLDAIAEERAHLHPSAAARKEDLLNEEHLLVTRLTELQDKASRRRGRSAEERAAAQTDLNRAPRLPGDRDER